MRAGKLTWMLLVQGIYPYCLNIAFWERFEYPLAKTPLGAFASVRSLRRIVMAVWLAAVAATTAFTYFVPSRDASPFVTIYFLVTFIAGFLFFAAPLMPGAQSLKPFERNLEKVLGMLTFRGGLRRPVHLMTLEEVRSCAQETILWLVDQILKSEEKNGRGSLEAESARENLRKNYNLFKGCGLTPKDEDGYKKYFEEAALRDDNLKKEVVPE